MNFKKLVDAVNASKTIVVIQADNPDGDSLASALALESILGGRGKEIVLYCGVSIPTYLRYMDGWDRIVSEIPHKFDLSIIIDTSSVSLLESLVKNQTINWLKTKPCAIIDHHATKPTIDFAQIIVNEEAVSTGEIIYKFAKNQAWEISKTEAEYIAFSILSDSLGLSSEAVTSDTMYTMAELIELGVNMAELDSRRRLMSKKSAEIVKYKGRLLQRISYQPDERIATVEIPWSEIEKYSHSYNPSMLVIDEMRMTDGVEIAIAFKTYPDGKVTAKIRSNYGYKIAGKVAEHFGGGGHQYAAGFKTNSAKPFEEIKAECILFTSELLDEISKDQNDEIVQHTF